jgi:hypothetical protein
MRHLAPCRWLRFGKNLRWLTLCLGLSWLVGCQAMMKTKNKNKDPFAQDKFSCGEALPGRNPH